MAKFEFRTSDTRNWDIYERQRCGFIVLSTSSDFEYRNGRHRRAATTSNVDSIFRYQRLLNCLRFWNRHFPTTVQYSQLPLSTEKGSWPSVINNRRRESRNDFELNAIEWPGATSQRCSCSPDSRDCGLKFSHSERPRPRRKRPSKSTNNERRQIGFWVVFISLYPLTRENNSWLSSRSEWVNVANVFQRRNYLYPL